MTAAAAASVMTSACRAPTQVTVEVVSELLHRPDMAVSVQLGAVGEVEDEPPRVITRDAWDSSGDVGTVVAVPSGSEGGTFAVRVVLAIGREPSSCTAGDAKGCVVVRRIARFQPGDASRLRVVLRSACLGTYCDAGTSCARDGACGALSSDEPAGDGGTSEPVPVIDVDVYAKEVLADRPRHYYRFDEPVGARVAKDATGRADGAYEGGVTLGVTGALGTSTRPGVYFDGRDGAVVVPNVDDLPGASSFEAWVRSDGGDESVEPTAFERVDRVGSESFGYRFSRPPKTVAAFSVFRGAETQSVAAQAFRFAGYAHFVVVVMGGSMKLYVDGVVAGEGTFRDQPPPALLSPFVVGGSRSGGGAWRGAIDELAIYDYPLSTEQMSRHRRAAGDRPSP